MGVFQVFKIVCAKMIQSREIVGYMIPIIGQAKIFSVSITNSLLSFLNLLKLNNRDPRETSLCRVYCDIQFNNKNFHVGYCRKCYEGLLGSSPNFTSDEFRGNRS